jgi:iron complex outermembrane receptor protein
MKQMYLKCTALLLFSLITIAAYAQKTVTGKVADESGVPLPGVSVVEKGTKNGTSTNATGTFSISVKEGSILTFTSVGYLTKDVSVATSSAINVTLSNDEHALTEVSITTALGIKREKKALGYAVQKVSGADLTIAQAPTIAQGLMGKVAGLNISQSGGGAEGASSRIVIRGNTSLTGDNRALIIVDGVAINNDPLNSNKNNEAGGASGLKQDADVSGYNDWGTGLNFINPDDIEDITVLKGPAAAALYGARGANGVILVTRKKGMKKEGLGVDYSFNTRGIKAYEFLDFQNEYGSGFVGSLWTADQAKQFPTTGAGLRKQINLDNGYSFAAGDYKTSAYGDLPYDHTTNFYNIFSFPSGLSWGPRFDDQPILWYDGVVRSYSAQPDNWKAYFPNGSVSQHNVSVSGGNDFGTLRFSYTRDDNKANILNSKFGTNTFNLGSSIKISKKVTAEVTGSYINYERLNTPPIGSGSFLAGFSYAAPRDFRSDVEMQNDFAANGSRIDVLNQSNFPAGSPRYPYYGSYMANSFWKIYKNNTMFNRNQLIGGAKVMAEITDWLNLTAQGGVDNSNDITEVREYPTNVQGTAGAYKQASSKSLNRNLSAILRLHKENLFEKQINASLSGGVESYYRNDYSVSNRTDGDFVSPFIFALNNGSKTPIAAEEIRYAKKINSAFGFLDLSYNDYLFLQVTGRNDWSSTLASEFNSYFYPSANLSYVFSEGIGGLQQSAPWLSLGKLSFSYAETGSDTDPYTIFNLLNTTVNNGQAAQSYSNMLKFEGIKPQRTRAYELGLNLGFLKNRLNVEISAYSMKTYNQILTNALPISSGFDKLQLNKGSLGNKGLEFIISAKPVATKDFSWNISVNAANSRTKVLALDENNDELRLGTFFGSNGISQRVKVGENYGTLYGKDFTYLNGQKVVKDAVNGTDKMTYTVGGKTYVAGTQWVLTADEVPIGNSQPLLTGGISNNFRYKNFSLYAMVDAKIGGDTYFGTYAAAMGNGLLQETLKERNGGGLPLVYPDGTTANTGISFGGVYADGTPNTNVVNPLWYYTGTYAAWNHIGVPRSAAVFENTWIKLREVVLSYQVPQELIKKTRFLQNLNISLVGRDLFYIYTSIPKGLNPEGVNGIGNMQGIEYSSVPKTRSLGLSIKTSF